MEGLCICAFVIPLPDEFHFIVTQLVKSVVLIDLFPCIIHAFLQRLSEVDHFRHKLFSTVPTLHACQNPGIIDEFFWCPFDAELSASRIFPVRYKAKYRFALFLIVGIELYLVILAGFKIIFPRHDLAVFA